MIEFLADYGLFLLKVATVAVAIIIVIVVQPPVDLVAII